MLGATSTGGGTSGRERVGPVVTRPFVKGNPTSEPRSFIGAGVVESRAVVGTVRGNPKDGSMVVYS